MAPPSWRGLPGTLSTPSQGHGQGLPAVGGAPQGKAGGP